MIEGPRDIENQRQSGEKIKSAAVEKDGRRSTGTSHAEAWGAWEMATRKVKPDLPERVSYEGFESTAGRFMSRKEALEIAKRNNQVRESEYSKIGVFRSEDLIPPEE